MLDENNIEYEQYYISIYIDLILCSFYSNICGETPKCYMCKIKENCNFNK